MSAFVIAALLLTAAAVALLARPLLAQGAASTPADRTGLNAALLRDELARLEKDRASAQLDEASYTHARDDLARRVLEEIAPTADRSARSARAPRTLALVVLALPLAAGLLYAARGTPQALLDPEPQPAEAAAAPDPQVAKMVDQLNQKLAAHPDDPAGWAMLGRSYTVLGRYDEAVKAFERIGATLDEHGTWLAEFADAAAMQAGGNPVGRPEQLALRALRSEPDNALALMMASYGAAARGDFAGAVPLIEHGLQVVPAETDDHRFLEDLLARSRARQAEGRGQATAASGASARTALSLEVVVAPALRSEAAGRTLLLIARAPGQRMPLAVIRRVPVAWPVRVVLDDGAALDPARPLASVSQVQVEARLSATGDAAAAADDLVATTDLPTGHATAAVLTIDHRRQ